MESGSKKLSFDSGVLFTQSILFVILFLLQAPQSDARERKSMAAKPQAQVEHDNEGRRVVYKQKNVVDFDAMLLEGDIRNPNEFYFVHRPEEKFGSLVKRRKNFHKEILRDSVMIR